MKKNQLANLSRQVIVLLLLLLISACSKSLGSGVAPETAQLALSEAKRSEAETYAVAEYRLAHYKIKRAQEELGNKRYEEARRLLEQATVDARYAQVRAQAERAREEAITSKDTANTIKNAF